MGRLLLTLLLLSPGTLQAGSYSDAVRALELEELAQTLSPREARRQLGRAARHVAKPERSAAALLLMLGAITPEDLSAAPGEKLDRFIAAARSGHKHLRGRLDDDGLLAGLFEPLEHAPLLGNRALLDRLGGALESGLLTGYDLRPANVYAQQPTGLTFVYSHSSRKHLRQLVLLLQREGVRGWLYVAPKVSAFLFRDEWGTPGPNVATLKSGAQVVQGREMAILFRFDSAGDRLRFHELIQRFAKKDEADEPGLIADAWWQPFYYSDTPFENFQPIDLVVITTPAAEATLTVLPERTALVTAETATWSLSQRVDRVWVNPAFFRFLGGDYR
ncbi:MAG: hypothetical protein AAGI15_03385 [Pseudomonadota bacterium]